MPLSRAVSVVAGRAVGVRGVAPTWGDARGARRRVITAGSSIAASTFIGPPQVAQSSMSIRNTRCRRGAPVIARVASDWSPLFT